MCYDPINHKCWNFYKRRTILKKNSNKFNELENLIGKRAKRPKRTKQTQLFIIFDRKTSKINRRAQINM